MCPNYELIKVKLCDSVYWGYFQHQYCYCTNARIVERRITHVSYFEIPKPLFKLSYYYHNELVVENVLQCSPTPNPYCYQNRQFWLEEKYPNYQRLEVWVSTYGLGFELQYCYCTNAEIVETTRHAVAGKKKTIYII